MLRNLLCALMFLSVFCSAAHAAAVSNLTDSEQLIQIRTSDGWRDVRIAPGGTWRVYGMETVRFNDRETRVEYDQEFAIWPSGDFGPQRRLNIMHKGFR